MNERERQKALWAQNDKEQDDKRERLKCQLSDPSFRARYDADVAALRAAVTSFKDRYENSVVEHRVDECMGGFIDVDDPEQALALKNALNCLRLPTTTAS